MPASSARYRTLEVVQGYPGRSSHGSLGWSSIALLQGDDRVVLADTGGFGVRPLLRRRLAEHGVGPADVTDVLLTHSHYDHAVNFPLFPAAAIWISEAELSWAAGHAPGFDAVPELYAAELAASPRVRRIGADGEVLPGIEAFLAPGHSPGGLVFRWTSCDGGTVVFAGDAVKNRAELLSGRVDMTVDAAASAASLALVRRLWVDRPGTLLIPGHDLPLRLDSDGQPAYAGVRDAAVEAWLGDDLDDTTTFDLTGERGR
jgi:N-acyl homoserine lactone hydrolase